MIMFLVWLGLAFFAGLALYIVTPWTAAKIAGDEWVESVSDSYTWLAQTAATKSAIVDRDGTLELVSKRFDADILGDKDKEHGDPRHHRDGFDVLSRLRNKSFGVALGDRAEYVSPLLAELGQEAWRAKEEDEIGADTETVNTEDEPQTQDVMNDGILVEKTSKLVDLSRARHLTTGDADPEDGHESYVWTKISQEKFNEKLSFGQTMVIVIGALGSMVAMFYLTSQTGGAGGGGGGGSPAPTDNTTTVSFLFAIASVVGLNATEWLDVDRIIEAARKPAAVLWIIGWIVTWPITAFFFEGIVMALLVAIVMTGVAMAIPGSIALFGPSIPKSAGLILARGHWILAQLTVGRGILVRRETGEYEYHQLHEPETTVDETLSTSLEPTHRVNEQSEDLSWSAQFDAEQNAAFVGLETSDEIEEIADGTLTVVATVEESGHEDVGLAVRDEFDEDDDEADYVERESQTVLEADVGGAASIEEGIALPGGTVSVDIDCELTLERDLDHQFETTLSDGTTLPVKGSEGDLYRFGWAPLGITEEKGAANMGPITQSPPADLETDGGRIAPNNTRQGYRPLLKIPDQNQWLVTLPQLWSWCQGTSESKTIEQGRDKALSEHGGSQQIGMAVFSIVVLASVVIGGAFGYLAAGGLG